MSSQTYQNRRWYACDDCYDTLREQYADLVEFSGPPAFAWCDYCAKQATHQGRLSYSQLYRSQGQDAGTK